MAWRTTWVFGVCAALAGTGPWAFAAPPADDFGSVVKPFLVKYCTSCHNDAKMSAGLSLEPYADRAGVLKHRDVWEGVQEQLAAKTMPSKKSAQPTPAERDAVLAWIKANVGKLECGLVKDPGRPTLRRLNRAEYNNTVRDLFGVKVQPADDFPSDDVGYGFDNIGDVLSLPPILLEKYLTAADKVLDAALVGPVKTPPATNVFRAGNFRVATAGKPALKPGAEIAFADNMEVVTNYDFPGDGEYAFRIRAGGDLAGDELPKMVLKIDDGKPLKTFDVDAPHDKPKTYEVKAELTAGKKRISVAYTNDFFDAEKKLDRNLYVKQLEVEGPIGAGQAGVRSLRAGDGRQAGRPRRQGVGRPHDPRQVRAEGVSQAG